MTDLDAQIRERLGDPKSYAENGIEPLIEALLAVLDRHAPTHYDGQVQYAYVDEPVFSADGAPRGHVRVRGEPLPPDWCGPCSEVTPCDEVRDIAKALGVEVDGG